MHHAFCFCWPSLEMRKVKQRNIIDKYLTGPRMLITNTLIFSLLVQRIWTIPWLRLGCSYAGKIWIILTTAATGAGNWPYNLHAGKLTLPLLYTGCCSTKKEIQWLVGAVPSWPADTLPCPVSIMIPVWCSDPCNHLTPPQRPLCPIVQCQYRHRQTGDWALWRLERDLIKTW